MGKAALPVAVQKQIKPGQTVIGPQPGPQTRYLASKADITVFGGAASGGKSYGTLLYPIRNLKVDGYNAVIFRRTYKRIKMAGGLWDDSHKIYPLLGGKAHEGELSWTFKSAGYESTIEFHHLQYTSSMYDYKGMQAALIAFEELTEFDEEQFFYLKSRNRSACGVKPVVVATTNPDADSWVRRFLAPWVDDKWPAHDRSESGELRYFIRADDAIVWLPKGKKHPDGTSVRFIVSTLYDNKILMAADPGYEKSLKSLPLVERRRLLDGDWNIRHEGGKLFKKRWFTVVDAAPTNIARVVRGWDLAATEEKDDAKKSGPDFTAGVKVAKLTDGRYIVLDARRMREKPLAVQTAIKNTASQDGRETSIYMEEEGGSSGKNNTAHYAGLLAGYDYHGIRSTGSKVVRAAPASAQAEAGNILILRGNWNEDFLNEAESFPNERVHDDQIDAFTLAVGQLHSMNADDLLSELNARVTKQQQGSRLDQKIAAFLQ